MGDDEEELDDESSIQTKQSHADTILKKLHKQVRIKKREKLHKSKLEQNKKNHREVLQVQDESTSKTTTKVTIDKSDQNQTSPGIKSKKKSAHKAHQDSKENTSETDTTVSKESTTKRKKSRKAPSPNKKRKTEKENGLEIAGSSDGTNEETILRGSTVDSDDEEFMAEDDEPENGSKEGMDADVRLITEGQAHAEVGGFTVIGDVEQKSLQKVRS